MRRIAELRRLDPVKMADVERVMERPVFEELRRTLLSEDRVGNPPISQDRVGNPPISQDRVGNPSSADGESELRLNNRPRYQRPVALIAVAAAVALVVSLVVVLGGNGGLTRPITTPFRAASAFHPGSSRSDHKEGTWRLVDDLLTGTWQQNTAGPPPGDITCPSASACYVMSGHYPSAMAGAPLLSESLYVSTDVGSTWSELSMPSGFAPTSSLSCGDASDCAAGGTYNGQPVLVTTSDGGNTFTIDPLPSGVGKLYALSCPTAQFCGGLVASSADDNNTPSDATFLSTTNGGSTFTDSPIVAGDSMSLVDCPSATSCTVAGTNDAFGVNDWTAGVAAVTTDGGAQWTAATLPAGFGVDYRSQLSCADALNCSLTGNIAITVKNPPQCASIKNPLPPRPTSTTVPPPSTLPSPAVQAIAAQQSEVASAANQDAGNSGSFSCSGNEHAIGSDIASTRDGGLTWTPDQLPSDVPQPQFSGLSCPTDNECWASGEEAVPQQVGSASDGGSSMLLGTTDGGATWSKVTFSVPDGAPNYDGQSYLSIGLISCATANVCAALGGAAQSSPTAPVYSLVIPASG